MKKCVWILAAGMLGMVSPSWGAEPDRVEGEGGCPIILHTPVVSVVRGTPAVIPANISCENGEITDVLLQVRIADAGKPTPYRMVGDANGLYKATVPLSLIRGLTRFWYYIDVRGKKRGDDMTVQTRWYSVTIVEHGELLEGGAAPAAGNADEEGGALSDKKGLLWLAGGAALIGGAIAIENANDDDGSGGGTPVETNAPPKKKEAERKKKNDSSRAAALHYDGQ